MHLSSVLAYETLYSSQISYGRFAWQDAVLDSPSGASATHGIKLSFKRRWLKTVKILRLAARGNSVGLCPGCLLLSGALLLWARHGRDFVKVDSEIALL